MYIHYYTSVKLHSYITHVTRQGTHYYLLY